MSNENNTRTIQFGNTGRTRTFGRIVAASARISDFKKNRMSVELRQEVTDHYPTGRPNNDLFSNDEFNFESKDFSNTRVCFIDAPVMDPEQACAEVQKRIDALYEAGKFPIVHRQMSLEPILSDDHKGAISAGLTTKEAIAEKQISKKPVIGKDGKETTELLTFNGMPFYRVSYFRPDYVEDVDTRAAEYQKVTTAQAVAEETAQ